MSYLPFPTRRLSRAVRIAIVGASMTGLAPTALQAAEVKLGGYVKTDVTVDFDQDLGPPVSASSVQTGSGAESETSVRLHSLQTRFNMTASEGPVKAFVDADLRTIRDSRDQDGVATEQQAALHFALANILDRSGHYEDAFAHYAKANQIKPGYIDFDAARHLRLVDRMIGYFDSRRLSSRTRFGSGLRPVFIVAMPRSGTTLVEPVLSRHPQVAACGERDSLVILIQRLAMPGGDRQYPEYLDSIGRSRLIREARASFALERPTAAGITHHHPVTG